MSKRASWLLLTCLLVATLVAGAIFVEQRLKNIDTLTIEELLSTDTTSINGELPKRGTMPEFQGINEWLNTTPLTPAALKGKVVLVDFWTYSCINCIRTFPYLKDWYAKYKDQGFVIVGVHTPEFQFEKKKENVERSAFDNGLTYPIALDSEYKTWRAYRNRYWPATYLFDRDGILRYMHHGEGEYDVTEAAIQELLGVQGDMTEADVPNFTQIRSPETYFGTARAERESTTDSLTLNEWVLEGGWGRESEYAQTTEDGSTLTFNYSAGVVNFVMAPPVSGSGRVEVSIDGTLVQTLTVNQEKLYEVYRSEPGEHQVSLKFLDVGTRVYAVTFGS